MRTTLSATLILLLGTAITLAADDLDSLQKRFKERYPQLMKHKEAGKIGETWEGYVEVVSDGASGDIEGLIQSENSDRRKLYALIAEKEGTAPDRVAARNAARNFEKAGKGEYLKGRDGQWKRKG